MDAVQPHYQTVSQYPKYIFHVENYFVATRDATLRREANTSELGVPKTHNNQMIEIT